MTLAQWFTHYEHGGIPIEKAALGSCDLSQSRMSAANGNGCGDEPWLLSRCVVFSQ
jgi:uncharacterized protein YjbI with pentapeptide repeats